MKDAVYKMVQICRKLCGRHVRLKIQHHPDFFAGGKRPGGKTAQLENDNTGQAIFCNLQFSLFGGFVFTVDI